VLKEPLTSADKEGMRMLRLLVRTPMPAPTAQLIERTPRFHVFTWTDAAGNRRSEARQVVIVRDTYGELRESFLYAN
jgi:hypothetical protein